MFLWNKIQADYDKIKDKYTDLSQKHDDLVDFTRDLQINFLHLINHVRFFMNEVNKI